MSTDSSPLPNTPTTRTSKRRKSYVEEEDIVVKPSTELIPDEYEYFSNEAVSLHIFHSNEDENLADKVVKSLLQINYEVTVKNLHTLDKETSFLQDLESIKQELSDKDALILIFIGFFKHDGCLFMVDDNEECQESDIHVKNIWNMFSANNCEELKNKPKMFFFCTSPPRPRSRVLVDAVGHHTVSFDKVYDFPAESDILIVYMKTQDSSQTMKGNFIKQLCKNIEQFSKKYDIIDLMTLMQKSYPLTISTLTRKFYLTPSGEREHYLSIVENNDILENRLRLIKESMGQLEQTQKKKKEKKFFSFKRKSEDKPKIEKKTENKSVKPKIAKPPASPIPVGRRSRQTSESDHERKISTSKKPLWRI